MRAKTHAPLDGWWWMGWAVPIPTATCPHGVPQTPAWPCCCHGTGSHLAQGRLHPTHGGHPARCTHGHPRLLPLQILPVGSGDTKVGSCHGAGSELEQCTRHHPSACFLLQLQPCWEVPWALPHLPVPICLDSGVAAVPGVPFHCAHAEQLPQHPALLHKDAERTCPGTRPQCWMHAVPRCGA